MLDTKEPLTDRLQTPPQRERYGRPPDARPAPAEGRPETIIMIGLVAVVSMIFGFVLGLLF
jgi:hypothetical protein